MGLTAYLPSKHSALPSKHSAYTSTCPIISSYLPIFLPSCAFLPVNLSACLSVYIFLCLPILLLANLSPIDLPFFLLDHRMENTYLQKRLPVCCNKASCLGTGSFIECLPSKTNIIVLNEKIKEIKQSEAGI